MARERRSSDVSAACRKLMKEETVGERLVRIWIWEYVLKFSSDEGLIRELLDSLAFPDDVPRLKQMLLLKELSGQIVRGLVLQKALDTLEGLLEVVSKEEATKEAEPGPLLEEKGRRGRKRLRAPGSGTHIILGMGSDGGTVGRNGSNGQQERDWSDLVELIKQVRNELQDETEVESSVVQNRKYQEVENKLKAFIARAWTELGPIFLEKIETAVMSGLYKGATGIQLEAGLSPQNAAGKAVEEEQADKVAEKVTDTEQVICEKTSDLERARRGLLASVAQFEKLVKDPLPAALERVNENGGDDSVHVPGSTSGRGVQSAGTSTRCNLLDPHHPSAHAHGWKDDDDNPPAHSPSAGTRRVQLPPPLTSPQQMWPLVEIQPMNQPNPAAASGGGNVYRRRKHKWSEEEVETLKREVWKYGKGRWKLILQNNYDVFQDRTEVNLKDKWRNLERYEGIRGDNVE